MLVAMAAPLQCQPSLSVHPHKAVSQFLGLGHRWS